MRLNINERDTWNALQAELNNHAVVLLNGVEQKYVTCADEEQGYIERYALDKDGRVVIEGNDAKIERLEGRVRIKDKRDEYTPTR
ncbi:prohead core and protease protein [Xanthomonas phage Langgrundblatt1]|uniref:Prohead core and protease protein n=1 Tax=Xanthomonas phage Langgrundblatt1 TaxID=2939128 RepID=A0A9E7E0S8_9CAUD|nr:prohead core and protease protein [Xanthomonas phage Langgrundblatt1]URA06770.1 prohead core and protease protein [Xanthomonas phage Langgrundblatt1]